MTLCIQYNWPGLAVCCSIISTWCNQSEPWLKLPNLSLMLTDWPSWNYSWRFSASTRSQGSVRGHTLVRSAQTSLTDLDQKFIWLDFSHSPSGLNHQSLGDQPTLNRGQQNLVGNQLSTGMELDYKGDSTVFYCILYCTVLPHNGCHIEFHTIWCCSLTTDLISWLWDHRAQHLV